MPRAAVPAHAPRRGIRFSLLCLPMAIVKVANERRAALL